MGYFVDQYGRTMYQPDPMPMDNLSQLRAQRQMPQIQQPTQGAQMLQAQQPQANQSWAYVQGESAAKSWYVGNGQSVLLMDSESPVFYVKTVDTSGIPLPLRIFDYTERTQSTSQSAPQAAQNAPENLDDKYVTRTEYEALQAKYTEIMEKLNGFHVAADTGQPAKGAAAGNAGKRTKGGNADE